MKKRGYILGYLLALFTILTVFALALAGAVGLYQRSATSVICDSLAQNLADTLFADAHVQLKRKSSYGTAGESITHDLKDAGEPSATGILNFAESANYRSINNSDGSYTGKAYADTALPPGTVQLLADMQIRGIHYVAVDVVSIAPYPHVVATAGSFTSNGNMLLGAMKSLPALADGVQKEDLEKGSLLSDADLTITGPADVAGDLNYLRTQSLSGVNQLSGDLKQLNEPEEVPRIVLSEYDPAGKPEISTYDPSDHLELQKDPLDVSGLARYKATDGKPLNLPKGLTLNSGVLYVEGDLVIGTPGTPLASKGVTGFGAVFCTGALTVVDASDLGTDSLCALVCAGDLTLTGAGATKSQFRGLVYSTGSMKVSDVTIVGALVGNSSVEGSPGPSMTVERSNLVYDPKAVQMDLDLQFGLPKSTGPNQNFLTRGPQSQTMLNPKRWYNEVTKRFDIPTPTEVQAGLQVHLYDKNTQQWTIVAGEDISSSMPQGDAALKLISKAADAIAKQIRGWNEAGLGLDSPASHFHMDLNRFLKAQTGLKTLTRRLERVH